MKPVVSVIAGATKPEQVRANAAAGAWEPTRAELHELGVKEIVPTAKLSLFRSSLPENIQVVTLDSRAR